MRKIFTTISTYSAIIVVALVVFASGFFAGKFRDSGFDPVYFNNVDAYETVDFSEFLKVWEIIDEKYKPADDDAKISDKEKMYGAISGLVESLGDPYSQFFPPAESSEFESTISGEFFGIGMEVDMKDDLIVVVSPLKGTPAEKAGILPGDIVFAINDEPTLSMTLSEAVDKIRGPLGTKVKLTMLREGVDEPIELEITREKINIPTLKTEYKDDVFIISLYNFSANSANQYRSALREFISSGKSKMILDLRGNPGGYLEAAVDMASWYLPAGKIIVRENFGDKEKIIRSKGYDIFTDELKMVVLINKGSASASEILAGALKEHKIATIVGVDSFGKGSVQEVIDINDETSLKITIAQWLTPDGNSISNGGLKPDVIVDTAPEGVELKDYQMQKALELLK